MLEFEEPFTRFRAHGHDHPGRREDVEERGNVVNPDEYIDEWGADTFRTYLMFLGPYRGGRRLPRRGICGPRRFLDRLWVGAHRDTTTGQPDAACCANCIGRSGKSATDIPRLSYNTAIAAMMEYMNVLRGGRAAHRIARRWSRSCSSSRRSRRTSPRSCGRGSVTRRVCSTAAWPTYDVALRRRDRDDRGAGQRQNARHRGRRA